MASSSSARNVDASHATRALLGGLAARDFLVRHWQKRPLLVRGAWPRFEDPVSVSELFRLATRDDCESRLVVRANGRWRLQHGPFRLADLRRLPRRGWTLLVQGLNHFVPAADRMLRAFGFIPYARLDDVMVSYAVPDGGVGPHFDSYDVFLLQGRGRRKWRVSRQRDLDLDPGAPLKILSDFRPQREWVLEPGDLLYLPPDVAHEGTALEPCTTYSIGFRAPSERELAEEFLAFLQDRVAVGERRYADPDLRPAARPAEIPAALVECCARVVKKVRWRRAEVEAFVGAYLSAPKPNAQFTAPPGPLGARAFERACVRTGLRLAPLTGMLYRRGQFHVNGEPVGAAGPTRRLLERLADDRRLAPGTSFTRAAAALLYTWYRVGYLAPGDRNG